MNQEEKIQFVKDCLKHTEDALLAKIARVPEDWDGYELRAWITLDIGRNIGGTDIIPVQVALCKLRQPRVKAFHNVLLVNDL